MLVMQIDTPPIVEKLRPYLSKIKINKAELQVLRLELVEARINAHQELQIKRRQMLWPKDKDLTELDRKTRLDGDCAPLERMYDFLVALEELVSDRLKLAGL